MSLILRCPECRSLNLEIRFGINEKRFASLHCSQCDRFIRWLQPYQAKAFARHLPESRQIELPGLEGES